jgi:hypothetical protein
MLPLLTCRGNTILEGVNITSTQLGPLSCPAATSIPVDGDITCSGNYTVQQDDIEAAGDLVLSASATSTSLSVNEQPAPGFQSVVINSNPQLSVDVLADHCTHNLTSE